MMERVVIHKKQGGPEGGREKVGPKTVTRVKRGLGHVFEDGARHLDPRLQRKKSKTPKRKGVVLPS